MSNFARILFGMMAFCNAGCGTLVNLNAPPPDKAPPQCMVPASCTPFGGVLRSGMGGIFLPVIGLASVPSDEIGKGGIIKGAAVSVAGVYMLIVDTPMSLVGDVITFPLACARSNGQPWALIWGDQGSDYPHHRFMQGITTPLAVADSPHSTPPPPPPPPGVETPRSTPPPMPRPSLAPPGVLPVPPAGATPP